MLRGSAWRSPGIRTVQTAVEPRYRLISHIMVMEDSMMKQHPEEREHGTSITLRNGLVKSVSQSFTSLTGYEPEMVTGKTIEELLVNDLKATLDEPELIKKAENLHCFIYNRWMIPEEVYISFTGSATSGETIVSFHTLDSSDDDKSIKEKYERLLERERSEKEDLKKALKAKDNLFPVHCP